MLTAKKTWYNDAGDKQTTTMTVIDADNAFSFAEQVFRRKEEACEVTLDTFEDGSFVTRVMSKHKMIFKIEFQA